MEEESGLRGESVAQAYKLALSGSIFVVHDRNTLLQQGESNLIMSCVCGLDVEKTLALNSGLLMAVTVDEG